MRTRATLKYLSPIEGGYHVHVLHTQNTFCFCLLCRRLAVAAPEVCASSVTERVAALASTPGFGEAEG